MDVQFNPHIKTQDLGKTPSYQADEADKPLLTTYMVVAVVADSWT